MGVAIGLARRQGAAGKGLHAAVFELDFDSG